MKKTVVLISVALILIEHGLSQNFWQQTAFNYGGSVYALIVSNSGAVIAGKNDKIYRSTDIGNSWTQITTLANDIQCFGKKNQNGYMFAGIATYNGQNGGVYRSMNDGLSWSICGLQGKYVNNIVVTPNGTIFAACSCMDPNCGGVHKSTDNGSSWSVSLNTLYDVYGLAVDDAGTIYAGTCDIGSSGWGQVLKSTDNGNTWNSIGWFSNWGKVKGITVDHNGVIYCIPSGGQVYRSSNGGTTWTQVLSGLNYYNTFPILSNSINKVYIASFGEGVFESTDGGNTWPQINSGLTSLNIVSLAFDLSQYLYAGSMNSSIFRSISSTCSPPVQPGSISGNNNPCQSSNQTYSVSPVTGATSYTWTLPAGWTGSSTTNSITTTVGSNNGTITVTANNTCGSSPTSTLDVTVSTTPVQPGAISGINNPCQGSNQTYSVSPVTGATSYTWTIPPGWTGFSTTNSITSTVGSNNGTITVTGNNTCGSSPSSTLDVTVSTTPVQPGTISGNNNPCQGSTQTYSISPVTGATSYAWTLPTGWTGSSITNSITTTVGSNNGTINVSANNTCGSSPASTLDVTFSTTPAQPGIISGNNNPCEGSVQTYSVPPVLGATSYTWILPLGWTGSSTSNSIMTTVGLIGGEISVTADNVCGSSAASILSVMVEMIPTQPGRISGNTTPQVGTTEVYSISPVQGATFYTWTLPQSWSGFSNTNSITATVGSSSGTITVTAGNDCGSSLLGELSVSVIVGIYLATSETCKIYPSPNQGIFVIEFYTAEKDIIGLEVINSLGYSVYRRESIEIGSNCKFEVNIQPVKAGLYFLILTTEKGKLIKKFDVNK